MTTRLTIYEEDCRDLDLTAEICVQLLMPIFGELEIEKVRKSK